MNNLLLKYVKTGFGVLVALALSQAQPVLAGWTGSMNGAGFGLASVNVTSSTLQSNKVTTPNMINPSAAMTNTPGYFVGAPLPLGASPATTALIKGSAGYIWKATTLGSGGDKTDDIELENKVNIPPAECASLEMDSSAVIAPDDKSGLITVNAAATAGTAIWLRGYEYLDPTPPQSVQDLETNVNSLVKWDILLIGPFDLNISNCTALIIPFTISTGTSNLYFVTDGLAKSAPLVLYTPSNIVVTCADPVVYAPVTYSGCGDVTVAYVPPAGSTFPVGTTPVVVTITDTYGNSTNATFTVTVKDTSAPTIPVLPVLMGQCSVQVPPAPTTTSICGATTNIVTGTTSDSLTYNTQGTFTVHWSFDDGNGNTSTANQTVIVKDTIPPVPPVIATAMGQCSVTVTAPTATDNCAGIVTGTTRDHLTYNTQGTFTVHWTFSDGNGNTSTANQTVIVKDTIPPVPPVIPTATGQCSVRVTPPTATDNCAGIVTGTTGDPLSYNTQGTFTVHWSFNDGNGNTSTANQTVIVKDTIPPVVPVLPTVNGGCSGPVTLTPPTTTDNCAGIVTGTTSDPLTYTNSGTFTVHWSFNDGNGNISTANQTVVKTSLTFKGFYSPIDTVNNTCASPVTVNQGCTLPVKFDMYCGNSCNSGGTPPVIKIQLWSNCSFASEPISVNAVYQNDWHYNWDTTRYAKGVYKIIVILPDGSSDYVFVKLR